MGESVGNKYKSFDVKQLKVNLIQIILFSSGTPEEQATDLVQNSIKDREIRSRKLESKKNEIISNKQKLKEPQVHGKRKIVPIFLGKIIKHKIFDEEEVKDIWYQGVVTEVLDDDETSDDCNFTVKCESFDDTCEVKLVEEWKNQCAIILGKTDEPSLKRMKITVSS